MDCGRRPHLPKICAQSDPILLNVCPFRQIMLNTASAVRASEKVQLSLIGNRQRAFHRAIYEPCILPLSPPKGGSKRDFLHIFALPSISSLQIIVVLFCFLAVLDPRVGTVTELLSLLITKSIFRLLFIYNIYIAET